MCVGIINKLYCQMDFVKGERVFVPKTGEFAYVIKTGGILGLKDSYAIVNETGAKSVFMGKTSDFVFVSSGMCPSGEKVDVPEDGVSLIMDFTNATKAKRLSMVKKYNEMSYGEKKEFCGEWCSLSEEGKCEKLQVKPKIKVKTRKEKTSIQN